jgi:hypothetical protein
MTKIEKCPYREKHPGWCGIVRDPNDSVRVVRVECQWCGARGPSSLSRADAIREWNRVARAARSEKKGGA